MKFNFGHGILLVLLLFMAGMISLVYQCSKQRIDLVSNNYYEKELAYENHINKERQTLSLDGKMQIVYDHKKELVTIEYPVNLDPKNISGTITFYKPDNASADFEKRVFPENGNIQEIATSSLIPGWWNVKVDWKSNKVDYYKEEKIFITN